MERKTVTVGGQVFEDVAVSKNKLFLASDDRIHVTNTCPQGYIVEVRKGSKVLIPEVKSGQTVTIRPSSVYRNEPTLFSVTVYKTGWGDKQLVYFRDEIVRIGGAPITASWVVTKDSASMRYEQQYYGY